MAVIFLGMLKSTLVVFLAMLLLLLLLLLLPPPLALPSLVVIGNHESESSSRKQLLSVLSLLTIVGATLHKSLGLCCLAPPLHIYSDLRHM